MIRNLRLRIRALKVTRTHAHTATILVALDASVPIRRRNSNMKNLFAWNATTVYGAAQPPLSRQTSPVHAEGGVTLTHTPASFSTASTALSNLPAEVDGTAI